MCDKDISSKYIIEQTKSFQIDYLKNFFEEKMNAREINENYIMSDIIREFSNEICEDEIDEPFYMIDLSHFARQYLQWNHYFPRIYPFYAVKSNPNKFIIGVLNKLGTGFDCASIEELDIVLKECGNDFDCASRIIYAHPCKPVSHIRYFRNAGVQMTVVDNIDELKKLSIYWPEAKVLIRLKPDDTHSIHPLSSKFGANINECINILVLGRELNMNLIGCTFHVGSRCYDPQIYVESIKIARYIFDIASSDRFKFKFNILDIGGGFMGHHLEEPTLLKVSYVINNILNILFPKDQGIRIISEPGRYFCSNGITLVCRIIGRRIFTQSQLNNKLKSSSEYVSNDHSKKESNYIINSKFIEEENNKKNLYYINDGIYGTFNAIIFDKKIFLINYIYDKEIIENKKEEEEEEYFESIIFGPTCDSIDCITNSIYLPILNINDIIWFPNVGSYTSSSASNFNGFKTNKYRLFWHR